MKTNQKLKNNRHLQEVLKTPGAKQAQHKRKYYGSHFHNFWNLEKADILYLIICAVFFVFKVLVKLYALGKLMTLLAGLGTGLFFILIPVILINWLFYKKWIKKLNRILAWHHLRQYIGKV